MTMNNQSLMHKNTKKAVNVAKPQDYSTTRNYQDILRGESQVKPVSETIKEFIKNKFSRLA